MDHREIGNKLELFFFDEISPGSCFFKPHGATIYNNLINFLRYYYKKLGYQEVITPNLYNKKLWEISGHWEKYKENMFMIDKDSMDKDEYSLKPMNCPGHCIMFKHSVISYRDLPLKYADFGVLHRNEVSGALTGLTRVRRFQQDDAHIFCTLDQIEEEINKCLFFQKKVYDHFGFKFSIELSTRPEKYIGDIENWNKAEEILKGVIKQFRNWSINIGDGAFYGPKLDIKIKDSRKREHQCGTVQLDFNLPERFGLRYKNPTVEGEESENYGQPVMIHRAILGSVERFMAILLEHTSGRMSFWLSPRQICVVPVTAENIPYGKKIYEHFKDYHIALDDSSETLNKKIRTAEKMKYNYIFVVGQKEEETESINIRINKKVLGTKGINEAIELLKIEYDKRNSLYN